MLDHSPHSISKFKSGPPALITPKTPKNPPPVVSTVAQLKQLKFPYQPISLKSSDRRAGQLLPEDLNIAPIISTVLPQEAYKRGKGVVLGAGRWSDRATGSGVMATGIRIGSFNIDKLTSSAEDAYADIYCPNREGDVVWGSYNSVPEGSHTYMLTLNAGWSQPDDFLDYFDIIVNFCPIAKSQIVKSGDSYRVLFNAESFFEGKSIIMFEVRAKCVSHGFFFYNIQLVQMD